MEQLTEMVGVRLTSSEMKLLKDKAEELDRSAAWVVRECLRGKLKLSE